VGELSQQEVRLRIAVPRANADLISGELWRLGTLGIEELDEGAEIVLLAGFSSAHIAEAAARNLETFSVVEEFESNDYLDVWREFATIYRAGNRIVIRPPWVHYEPKASELIVGIDPGRSFGSGSHPSTRLALAELERLLEGNESVLDVGCGSGILSVAAARLGATRVLGIDIDPAAIEFTTRNAKSNGVADLVTATAIPIEATDGTYDVVISNMLASLLSSHGPNLVTMVRPGRRLVLSGLLSSQVDQVVDSCTPLQLLTTRHCDAGEGDWVSVTLG
jgi:ribosomal protein L11 methyltransferase